MAIVSRIATLTFSGATGSRTWQATAATQDTAAGSSVVITTTETAAGASPPVVGDVLTLSVYNTSGTLIRAFTLTPGAASQTSTFFFTDTGATGGASRCGTVMIDIRAIENTGSPTDDYDYETDGTPSTAPTTFTATVVDRGYIRGTTTSTTTLSNASLGGAKPSPFAFPDSIFVRTILGASSYVSRTVTHAVGAVRSGVSNSATQTFDTTFSGTSASTGRVNNGFLAAATVLSSSVTPQNDATTGQPFTVLTPTNDSATFDPRTTRSPLFQLDDNTFGTPPTIKHMATQRRTNAQQGFLGSRTTNARGEGQNGITYSVTLTPRKPGTAVTQTGLVTVTQGGETGWAPSLLAWSSSLPGGIWDKDRPITAPADITGATYAVQAAGTSTEYTLVSKNPDYDARVNVNHTSALAGRHFNAGMVITAVGYMVDTSTQKRVAAALMESVKFTLVRANPSDVSGLSNTFQFFNGTTWVDWTSGTAQTTFTATASPADAQTFEYQFTDTTAFGQRDFRTNVQIVSEGSTYTGTLVTTNLDTKNQHDAEAADEVTLLDSGRASLK